MFIGIRTFFFCSQPRRLVGTITKIRLCVFDYTKKYKKKKRTTKKAERTNFCFFPRFTLGWNGYDVSQRYNKKKRKNKRRGTKRKIVETNEVDVIIISTYIYAFCRTPRVANSCSRASSKSASSYRQRCCGGVTCDSRRQLISASLFFYSRKLPLLKSNQHRSERLSRERKEGAFEYYFYIILCLWSVWRNVDFLSFKPSIYFCYKNLGTMLNCHNDRQFIFLDFMEWMVEQVPFFINLSFGSHYF